MGITIDDSIKALLTERKTALHENKKAFDFAVETMRKYQKIVDIVSLNDEEFKQCGLKELKEILEVIAYGN
ncbi:MAG: hypothetical protein J6S67_13100 [Methanobrevibacter sp.]|nr:hypothetical protein [Methanobrevibacter sp.]